MSAIELAGSGIAALVGLCALVGIAIRVDRRMTRIETTLTKNGGTSDPPTMLDKIHDIDKKLDVHIAVSESDSERLDEAMDRIRRLERR